MNKPTIKISIASDVVCPWCYIGKRRLEKAMAFLSSKYTFDVEYLPFELNPQMPVMGVDQKAYLSQKFGGTERYQQITEHTRSVAATEGLDFHFDKQLVSPNTRKAHRLIQWAKEEGKQSEMVESFFRAYFTDGVDLSKEENLVDIAVANGLDREKTSEFLSSSIGEAEIEMAEQQLHSAGISGVPFYIVNNKYGISGAQPMETFVNAFDDISRTVTENLACDTSSNEC